MKILSLLNFFFASTCYFAQVVDIVVDNTFSNALDVVPLHLNKGNRILIEADSTVYLMNQARYDLCKSLANGDCEDHYEALLNNFKKKY